ncbi:hypothetical protein [Buttiauxella sp. A111]|uniref:hypothetical protein n=1 Tax=Buttiauxella sp. A111 TaxID=2563088 RepID=UPI0010EDA397|nr:hypothetical protein [Buttiauxella sp. A111]GDX04566.1 hypothetical protein BSPA111_07340 [Buttiauxella sp. A111]
MEGKSKRTILFISPSFFGYEKEIRNELEKSNDVICWDERPSNSTIYKIFLRLNIRILINKYNKKYYDSLLVALKEKCIDVVFIVNPEAIDSVILNELKRVTTKNNPFCKFVMYLWDSINNKPGVRKIIQEFDSVFTFERSDADAWGVGFLPLFYSARYNKPQQPTKKYDLCFIGTAHSDRISIVNDVINKIEKIKKITVYTFFYFQSEMIFRLKNYLRGKVVSVKVNFKPLTQAEVFELIQSSEIIIDIHHPKQNGLTMRTIECVGLNKKIITTNKDIVSYDFYNPDMICVVSREDIEIPESFIIGSNLGYHNREKYSLSHWVNTIIPPAGDRE